MTAAELDIFSQLLDKPKTSKQVAKGLSSDPRATEMLLNSLVALELLVKEEGNDGAFSIRPGMEGALSSSSPETILPLILHMGHMWESWGELTDIVRNGKKEKASDVMESDDDGIKAFIGAMHTIGREMAADVVARLDLSDRENLIDVGGGSGVYTIAMLHQAPDMRATIFDRPPVIEIAKEKIAKEGLAGRVTLAPGDFYEDKLPGGHDVALLSAIIHMNSPSQNVKLYRKVSDALTPGGLIIIRDHVMNDDHTETAEGALFAINMLVATPCGGTYSFDEIRADLEKAGFEEAALIHDAEMDSLITAKKPVG
jgi:predicted O-methyltransferase YrrM